MAGNRKNNGYQTSISNKKDNRKVAFYLRISRNKCFSQDYGGLLSLDTVRTAISHLGYKG